MAYTTIDRPTDYFRTKLYSGNNNAQNIAWDETDVNMKPDFLWIKSRAGTTVFDHVAGNITSGSGKYVKPNQIDAEVSNSNVINTFNTNGFSVGGATFVSEGGRTYVAWGWQGAGSTSSNTDGDVTSTVSANTTSGFSVARVSNLNSNSFGHGLGVEPEFIMNKRTDDVANWRVYFKGHTSGKSLFLNTNGAETTEGSRISSANSSTVTVVGSGNGGSAGAGTSVYFCFAPIKGFSKIGTYTGNGNADGTFIYTGFKPAWILVKRTDGSGGWHIMDNKRDTINPLGNLLLAESSSGTNTVSSNRFDLLSNGFKCRDNSSGTNASGSIYIFLAFAESPFVTSTSIPTTAR